MANKELIQGLLNTVEEISGHCFKDIHHPSYWKDKNLKTTRHALATFLQSIGYMPKTSCV